MRLRIWTVTDETGGLWEHFLDSGGRNPDVTVIATCLRAAQAGLPAAGRAGEVHSWQPEQLKLNLAITKSCESTSCISPGSFGCSGEMHFAAFTGLPAVSRGRTLLIEVDDSHFPTWESIFAITQRFCGSYFLSWANISPAYWGCCPIIVTRLPDRHELHFIGLCLFLWPLLLFILARHTQHPHAGACISYNPAAGRLFVQFSESIQWIHSTSSFMISCWHELMINWSRVSHIHDTYTCISPVLCPTLRHKFRFSFESQSPHASLEGENRRVWMDHSYQSNRQKSRINSSRLALRELATATAQRQGPGKWWGKFNICMYINLDGYQQHAMRSRDYHPQYASSAQARE
jgi:hypothetical protein